MSKSRFNKWTIFPKCLWVTDTLIYLCINRHMRKGHVCNFYRMKNSMLCSIDLKFLYDCSKISTVTIMVLCA